MKKLFYNNLFQQSFANKVILGTFWLTLGSILSRGLLSLASLLLARMLTISEFGEFGMIKSTIDNFLIFASLGVGLTTTKYVSEFKDQQKSKAGSLLGASISLVLILSTIVAIIILSFSGIVAIKFLNNPGLQTPLIIGGFTLVFIALNGTQTGALLGLQAFKINSVSNIIQGSLIFLGLCIGGYMAGVKGALVGNLVGLVIASVVFQSMLSKEAGKQAVKVDIRNWKTNIKLIASFAIPASLSTIIIAPAIWLQNVMLVNEKNGFHALGIYSGIIIFSTAIQMFNGAIGNVLLPIFLSKSEEKSAKKEFFNYFGSWIISIVLALPFIVFPELVTIVLGKKFDNAQTSMILTASIISTLIVTNRGGVARDLIMKNKMWLSVFSMGQWAITSLLIFSYLKQYGALGLAAANMMGYFLNYVIFLPFFIHKKISPGVIFYNYWNYLSWILIFILAGCCLYFHDALLIRLAIALPLIALLFYSINKLYKKCLLEL